MKRVTIIIAFFSFFAVTLNSQTLSSFGVKGFRNTAWQRIDESQVPENSKILLRDGKIQKWGYGAYANFRLNRKWGMTTEFQMNNTKGGAQANGDVFRENFIAIPILLTRKFFFTRLEGGVELSKLRSAHLKLSDGIMVKQAINNDFDYGAVFGIRYDAGFANIGLRYIRNFADQGGISLGNPETVVPFQNSTYQLSVGVPLYKKR